MTTLNAFFHPRIQRIRRYLQRGSGPSAEGPETGSAYGPLATPGHARGHRHLGPPPEVPAPRTSLRVLPPRHPAWLDSGGRVDRLRRNERHGDEKE